MWRTNLTPEQIAENAEQVKTLYLKKGMSDEEIAKELNLYPQAAYQLRKLLGLARKYGDIERDVRKISFDPDKYNYVMAAMNITTLADRLGLDESKAYGTRVSEVSKGKFVIEVTEMKAITQKKKKN